MYRYRAEVTAAAGEASTPILLPPDIDEVAVTALPGSLATVQHTMDLRQSVVDDPASANWVDWDAGEVDVPTSRALNGTVTAIRVTAAGAPATLQVCATRDT